MDKLLDEFLKVKNFENVPNDVFNKYLEMMDDLPRRGFKLYGEFFEITADEDIAGKMANILKMQGFIASQKIRIQENAKSPNDDLMQLLNNLAVHSMFDKIVEAVAIGFATGIAFAIENMAKCDEEDEK